MSDRPVSVTDQQFESAVIQSEVPVLVDFWAPRCDPCRRVAPVLEELAGEYAGRLRIAKVNTEEYAFQAMRHHVRGIPTMILFKDGVEADRMVGAVPRASLKRRIDQVVAH
jgi:thioredoxin 1